MKSRIFATVLFVGLGPTLLAKAEPTATDRNLAQSLFDQSKILMEAARYEEACPKLEESQRLDPSGGTLLNLALCRELEGKVATAWSDFKEALSYARRDGREDRVRAAQEHIAALEPKLPTLTLEVADAADGEVVFLDGSPLGKPVWGTPLSIDPGVHQLKASASGFTPWMEKLTIKVGARLTAKVPRLDRAESSTGADSSDLRSPHKAQVRDKSESQQGQGSNTLGWIVGGTGVAAIGVGSYFGLRAISKRSESDKQCPKDTTCTGDGVALNNQAKTSAWVSNVSFGVGLVGIAVGAYLLWPKSESASVQTATVRRAPMLDIAATANGGEISMRGVW